jgi:hypothetical protein
MMQRHEEQRKNYGPSQHTLFGRSGCRRARRSYDQQAQIAWFGVTSGDHPADQIAD